MEYCLHEFDMYWETHRFHQSEDLFSLVMDQTSSAHCFSTSPDGARSSVALKNKESEKNRRKKSTDTLHIYDSSSPDRTRSSAALKNAESERKRRKKSTDRFNALRVAVPKITKMDQASTLKDAISYIQELQEQERSIQGEISQLESMTNSEKTNSFHGFNQAAAAASEKKKRTCQQQQQHLLSNDSGSSRSLPSPVQVIELRVYYVGGKTVGVSITCRQQRDTIVKLCEAFESLKLKVISANIGSVSGNLWKTVYVEAHEEEIDMLKTKIESAIAALNFPDSPMSC